MEERAWHKFYEPGVSASIDFEDAPVHRFLERSAAQYPVATALMIMNRRLSYRRLKEDVDRFATALAALGVAKDSKVAALTRRRRSPGALGREQRIQPIE